MIVEATEAAYLAGIIDGEGSIGIRKHIYKTGKHNNPGFAVYLEIRMTDKDSLLHITSVFGGNLSMKGKTKKGRTIFDYKVYGNKAVDLLKITFPYLKAKQRQARIAIDFSVLPNLTVANSEWLNSQRDARRNLISRFNQSGWAINT
jgi:hypothetical protein